MNQGRREAVLTPAHTPASCSIRERARGARGRVGAAAKTLSVHTNTVYYRLETIRSATGADLRDARVLVELELAVLSRAFGVLVVPGE